MQRRRFISLSGISVIGLLALRKNRWDYSDTFIIRQPEKVSIRLANQWFPMYSNKGKSWLYKDSTVQFQEVNDGINVIIASPGISLQAIRCSWSFSSAPASMALGDQWERSYGDLRWQPLPSLHKAPWYLMIDDGKQTNCFGVKTGANSFCYWQTDGASLSLTLDTQSGGMGVNLGTRVLQAATIITTVSTDPETVFATAHRFCSLMCPKPMLPAMPLYGINDWYFAYGNNSKEIILDHCARMAALADNTSNRPFSVIDAGWSSKSPRLPDDCCWGEDATRSNSKFGDMSLVAGGIKQAGMRPGLWVRPLSARSSDRNSLLAPAIKDRDDPRSPILDPSIPENLARISDVIDIFKSWGYQLVKHDYTTYDIFGRWGFQMDQEITEPGWHFYDQSKTNAEIILQLYQTIRRAAADMMIIGCNTISHLSAGLFEANRIGDDTSGKDWDRTRKMGVNTLGFRLVQHNAFYAADGDCVGLTRQVSWQRNKQWMQLLAESSAPLFISAAPDAVGDEQKQMIRKSFSQAASHQPLGEPLDWLKNILPEKWKLNDRMVQFDWS